MDSDVIATVGLGAAAVLLALALLLRRLAETLPRRRAVGPTSSDNGGLQGSPVPAVPRRPLGALSARAEATPEEEHAQGGS